MDVNENDGNGNANRRKREENEKEIKIVIVIVIGKWKENQRWKMERGREMGDRKRDESHHKDNNILKSIHTKDRICYT